MTKSSHDDETRKSRTKLSRRGVLGAVAATGLFMSSDPAVAGAVAEGGLPTIRAPKLKPGDKVRVVSPASRPNEVRMARGIEILESWGLEVELGKHVYDKVSYLAGTDADRLADLNDAFRDPTVRGVFCSRGGAGTTRIVDGMDLAAVRRDPKPFLGFSDITVLQLALWQRARLVTIHGPTVNWDDNRTGPESIAALRAAVMTTDKLTLTRDPANETSQVVVPGRARGVVLGGNLSMVAAAVGGRGFPNWHGGILLIEDTGEPPYHVDRFLTQLRNAGALRGLVGVAIGQFTDSVGNPGDWTIVDLLRDKLLGLGVPVLGGLPIGHGKGQLTIPIGTTATLDADAGTLVADSGVR